MFTIELHLYIHPHFKIFTYFVLKPIQYLIQKSKFEQVKFF